MSKNGMKPAGFVSALPLVHACGFSTKNTGGYAMHAKFCTGNGTRRTGRIIKKAPPRDIAHEHAPSAQAPEDALNRAIDVLDGCRKLFDTVPSQARDAFFEAIKELLTLDDASRTTVIDRLWKHADATASVEA